VEGVVCSLVEAAQLLPERKSGGRVLLTGGAAASPAVQQVAAAVLGPITLPEPAEYVAIGAARQAAWALSPESGPPDWQVPAQVVEADPTPDVLSQFRETRQRLYSTAELP
jgi:xylulokinase